LFFFYLRFRFHHALLNSFEQDGDQTAIDIASDWQEKFIQRLGKSITFLSAAKNNQK